MTTTVQDAPHRSLLSIDLRTLDYVTGPLIFVHNAHNVAYNEMVSIALPDGATRTGQRSEERRVGKEC
jgi:vacuolar-type H+-ATPase subunit B/Vma2